jgi:hypothetical protein
MAARLELREVTPQEGNRLLGIVRRGSGSVVTWRRAQIVLLWAQGMSRPRPPLMCQIGPSRVRSDRPRLGAPPA